jgi:two-component system nitrogen regulation response regulator GlnG
MRLLEGYPWPGNVRELQSAIKHSYVQSSGEVISLDCLPTHLRDELPAYSGSLDAESRNLKVVEMIGELMRRGESDLYAKVSLAVDRLVLETVLRHVKGNQVHAAEVLGMSRTTLRAKMRSLGLAIEKQLLSDTGTPE